MAALLQYGNVKCGIPVKKVQAVTRHKSERMTERYTHFNPLDFAEVFDLQAELLKKKPGKPETAGSERPPLSLVKMPEAEKTARRRQAS